MPVCDCDGSLCSNDKKLLRSHRPPNDRDSYLRSTDVDVNGTAFRPTESRTTSSEQAMSCQRQFD